MSEIDYLLKTSLSGVTTHEEYNGDAIVNNVSEWLNTPMGSVWGNPKWGHRLEQFRHAPQTPDTEVAIELSIASKLPADIDGVIIRYIGIEFLDIDSLKIIVGVNGSEIEVDGVAL